MYKVKVEHRYKGGEELKFEFETKSLLHVATKEAEGETILRRTEAKQDGFEKPVESTIVYTPIK